jgi:hypothetical protein
MYMRWPGQVLASATMVAWREHRLAPTIADAVGGIARVPMDGRSLFDPLQPDRLLTEHGAWAALRTRPRSTSSTTTRSRADRPPQYDLVADPFELENLLPTAARERPNTAHVGPARGRSRLRGPSCPKPAKTPDPARFQSL